MSRFLRRLGRRSTAVSRSSGPRVRSRWTSLAARASILVWAALLPLPASADLSAEGAQLWSQESPGIEGFSEDGDNFGRTVVTGDFDDDGFDDLAIGVAGEAVGGTVWAGAVNVIYGSAEGLTPDGNRIWHENSDGMPGTPGEGDSFGFALATGDFDNDGYDDLAIGASGEEVGGFDNAGRVTVLFGGPDGLSATGVQEWDQSSAGVSGTPAELDFFGHALCSGDFDDDGYDDLAIGVPGEQVGGDALAGAAHVLYGSPGGLSSSNEQYWHQDVSGTADGAEEGDEFGAALAAGDFDGNGYDDLAVGVSEEDLESVAAEAGSVHVLFGSLAGLTVVGNQTWDQDSPGVPDDAELNDGFGNTLATGDINGDGRDDLAVGISAEDLSGYTDAGATQVLLGDPAGLVAGGFWHQDVTGILDSTESFEWFGSSLAFGDFDGDGHADLGAGVPSEIVDTNDDAGAVNVLHGREVGLAAAGNQYWDQSSPGVPGDPETYDAFGWDLASGDFNSDGVADLAIGVPYETNDTVQFSGAVVVLYGQPGIFADGFESGDSSRWSTTGP